MFLLRLPRLAQQVAFTLAEFLPLGSMKTINEIELCLSPDLARLAGVPSAAPHTKALAGSRGCGR